MIVAANIHDTMNYLVLVNIHSFAFPKQTRHKWEVAHRPEKYVPAQVVMMEVVV